MKWGLPIITIILGIAGFLITENIGVGVFFALVPNAFVIGMLYDKLMGKGSDNEETK